MNEAIELSIIGARLIRTGTVRAFFVTLLPLLAIAPAASFASPSSQQPSTVEGRVIRANPSGRFELWHTVSLPDAAGENPTTLISAADINGDGRDELLVFSTDSSRLSAINFDDNGQETSNEIPLSSPGCDWRFRFQLSERPFDPAFIAPHPSGSTCFLTFHEMKPALISAPSPENGFTQGVQLARLQRSDRESFLLIQGVNGPQGYRWNFQERTLSPHSLAVGRTGATAISIGDFDGNLSPDTLSTLPSDSRLLAYSAEAGSPFSYVRFRSDLIDSFPTRQILTGDFDGDGRTDVFEAVEGFGGNSLAYFGPLGAIERHVDGIDLSAARDFRLLAADLNGDGRDEVVSISHAGALTTISAWRALEGSPIQGLSVTIDKGATTITGAQGDFQFDNIPPGDHALRVQIPGEEQISRRFITPAGARTAVNLVADMPLESSSGRALSLHRILDGPSVCTGYVPFTEEKWGQIVWASCPAGYALFSAGLERNVGPYLIGIAPNKMHGTEFSASCCKLPAADILTGEITEAFNDCPENTVAVGRGGVTPKDSGVRLRCGKINTARYRLGKRTPGAYWGISVYMLRQQPRILLSQIPAALRDGVTRDGYSKWMMDGCVGLPWGSLLVSKGINRCSGYEFRQLQFRGEHGDPPAGTPVTMFPTCEEVEDVFDPLSGCREKRSD